MGFDGILAGFLEQVNRSGFRFRCDWFLGHHVRKGSKKSFVAEGFCKGTEKTGVNDSSKVFLEDAFGPHNRRMIPRTIMMNISQRLAKRP